MSSARQDEPGQHIGLEHQQLIRPGRNARLTQASYDGQAQARASLAFTDPEKPATDTIDLQGTRETVTSQQSGRSGKEAQVQGLQKLLSPQGLWGYLLGNGPAERPEPRPGPTSPPGPDLGRRGGKRAPKRAARRRGCAASPSAAPRAPRRGRAGLAPRTRGGLARSPRCAARRPRSGRCQGEQRAPR
jgi:hypothetical protein